MNNRIRPRAIPASPSSGDRQAPQSLDETLVQRGSRYGPFSGQAEKTQRLKDAFRGYPGWHSLDADQREALDMIASKIARILNGDPQYDDNWIDVAGYAQLIVKRLHGEPL